MHREGGVVGADEGLVSRRRLHPRGSLLSSATIIWCVELMEFKSRQGCRCCLKRRADQGAEGFALLSDPSNLATPGAGITSRDPSLWEGKPSYDLGGDPANQRSS